MRSVNFVSRIHLVTAGVLMAALMAAGSEAVHAQNAFYAGIAYSQTTGKIGSTVRSARTEAEAQRLAVENCAAPDAKAYIWGPNQWVAIAVVDGAIGTAGFGRGDAPQEAQRKALDECAKRAHGEACRVALCIHSQGMRAEQLMSVPRDPKLPPPTPKSGFIAAIAFSPSTGKIGSTAGAARTAEQAQALALNNCGAPDAKVFMWGEQWIAVAVASELKGVAGFAPGATREAAEQAALAQCKKFGHGAPCRIALSIHSAGTPAEKATSSSKPIVGTASVSPASAVDQTSKRSTRVDAPAASSQPKTAAQQ
jgi:hypothetical protein